MEQINILIDLTVIIFKKYHYFYLLLTVIFNRTGTPLSGLSYLILIILVIN